MTSSHPISTAHVATDSLSTERPAASRTPVTRPSTSAPAAEASARQQTAALTTAPERDLVDSHRYGDPAAFEEIYRRFAPMVLNLAWRLAGDPTRAEDLTQEVFLRIHRHLPRFDGRSTLKTWIYRITLNHCRSKLSRKRLPMLRLTTGGYDEDEPGVAEPADERRGPEERTLARDTARQIQEALLDLPPKFREAVVLRDLEELSYEEIATVLGVRIGTVRSRIARGRDRLRIALESRVHDGHAAPPQETQPQETQPQTTQARDFR